MKTYITHWEQSVEEDKNSQNVETQRSERTTSLAWEQEVHKQNQSGGGCQRRQLRGRGGVHLMWAKRPLLIIIVVNSNSPTPKL